MFRLFPLFAALTFAVLAPFSSAHAAVYQPPVDGTIVDAFRPPSTPYGAGNRGWEYAVFGGEGATVVAPADGVVTFVGQVGGSLVVVLLHADGIRTTLARLGSLDAALAKGMAVRAGQPIGTAGVTLYFGTRCGTTYIDPARLFATHVFLVPLDGRSRIPESQPICNTTASTTESSTATASTTMEPSRVSDRHADAAPDTDTSGDPLRVSDRHEGSGLVGGVAVVGAMATAGFALRSRRSAA